jgi:hypothetical protein
VAAKWTLIVYMAGFNNLSPFAQADLEEMRRVGPQAKSTSMSGAGC